MDEIFSTKDIYNRSISLTNEQYNNHIVSGHSEMKSDPKSIEKTVEDPTYIFEDSSHPLRNVYYGFGKHKDYNKLYVTAIVHFSSRREGEVITSYLTSEIKESWGNLKYAKT